MTESKIIRLILGDQLNAGHSWFKHRDSQVTYSLMEILPEASYVRHHVQKICAFFCAMRHFARNLEEDGHRVIYLALDNPENHQSFEKNLKTLIKKHGFTHFEYQLPDEYRLDRQFQDFVPSLPVSSDVVDSEHFLSSRTDVAEFFNGKKKFVMESFYRHMRLSRGILMDGKQPEGGRWNYDVENRRPLEADISLPEPLCFDNDVSKILLTLEKTGVKTFGNIENNRLLWPVSLEQSERLLNHFISNGLPSFGTYQDAMTTEHWALFHSRLSFSLNTKMLHPIEIINKVVDAHKQSGDRISIEQTEGFIRQILGWREYMRGMYWHLMPEFETMNFFSHTEKLPKYYWSANTRMRCMAHAIGQSLNKAYAHHIQRLMVTGNFALLAGVHPDEVDEWYLGVYIDAVQWVELPNTRGMSQFADGGIIATKPYVSSGAYIRRMSDYCRQCHYRVTVPYGDRACPFNSFYWAFLNRHRKRLESNPRIRMMYRTWDKMDGERQRNLLEQAAVYMENLNDL